LGELGVQEVACSSQVTPTKTPSRLQKIKKIKKHILTDKSTATKVKSFGKN